MALREIRTGGGASFDPSNNPGSKQLVRSHLDMLLEKQIFNYLDAPDGHLEPRSRSELPDIVGYDEKNIAILGLFYISDARAQAQMPVGSHAGRTAYLSFIRESASQAGKSIGDNSLLMNMGAIFACDKPRNMDFRRKTYRKMRAAVLPEAGIGFKYGAEVAIGKRTYPNLEIPFISDPNELAVIQKTLLGWTKP
ncbi:MAG: hypothetical protein JWO35_837 [Candidatus Saccharibacteria bacterium]|nr:hypothetical protein [Candidatus Saccharibacteria bacterium]